MQTKTMTAAEITKTRRFQNANTIKGIVNAYTSGESMEKLAARFEASIPAIRRVLILNGVEIRPRGRYAA